LQVTLIHNLEVYGIDLGEFAHSVQKGVACSTSVTPLPGKQQGKEVLVQGNQIHYIEQLLTGRLSFTP
jgi:translation initiation factor 2D